MDIIVLKSSACLLILLAFYKLALEPLSIHKFKRVYLLVAVLISVIIPFITFIKYVDPTFDVAYLDTFHSDPTVLFNIEDNQVIIEYVNYIPTILWTLYFLGASLFLIRFCVNLFNIQSKIRKHTKVKTNQFVNVLIEKLEAPHTFFNFIFLNKTKFENQQIPKEVIIHEETHAKQKHSIDILSIELLQIVFWFNPLLYWLKKEVKLNHEFLADQEVLNRGFKTKTYQNILLSFSSNQQELALVNAINYSSIKKRFTLMKTQTPKKTAWVRSLLLLPLLAILLFSFSQTKEVEKKVVPKMEIENNPLPNNTDLSKTLSQSVNAINAQIMYVGDKDEYYKNATIIFRDKDKNIIKSSSYSNLTEREKKLLPNIPTKPMKKNPSEKQLNNWLDGNKYGVWLDGEKINNSNIETFKTSSFVHYYESRLEKNAINYGKYFYQVNLYTDKGYDKTWKDALKPLDKDAKIYIYYNEKALSKANKDRSNYSYTATFTEDQTTKLLVNGIECDKCELVLTKKEISDLTLTTNSNKEIKSFNFKVPGRPTVRITGNKLNTKALEYLKKASDNSTVQGFHIKTEEGLIENYFSVNISSLKKGEDSSIPPPPPPPVNPNATPEEKIKQEKIIKEYNKSNKVIKGKVYKNPPPPPPSPRKTSDSTGLIEINGKTHFYSVNAGKTKYYNRWGNEVDKQGNKLSEKQTDGSKVVPGQKITKVYKDGKVVTEFEQTWEDNDMSIPPPPPPAPKNGENSGPIEINGKTYYFVEKNGVTKYFDRFGNLVSAEGKRLNDIRAKRSEMIAKMKEREIEHKNRLEKREEAMKTRKVRLSELPPPPPKDPIDHVVDMAKKGASFYYNGKQITSDKAIDLVKKNPELNISSHTNNGVSTVHLSEKPIRTVNGKVVKE